MAIELKMPALSPTMEEGTLARWLKAEGDTIEPGDIIAEIETDKATMEFEAVDEGVLTKILIPAGTEVKITSGSGAASSPSRCAMGRSRKAASASGRGRRTSA